MCGGIFPSDDRIGDVARIVRTIRVSATEAVAGATPNTVSIENAISTVFSVRHFGSICVLCLLFRSLLGKGTYAGFLVDWCIEAIAISASFVVVVISMSVYFGCFCYINGMTKDARNRLGSTKAAESRDQVSAWPLYVREIEFHIEITGYAWAHNGCQLI